MKKLAKNNVGIAAIVLIAFSFSAQTQAISEENATCMFMPTVPDIQLNLSLLPKEVQEYAGKMLKYLAISDYGPTFDIDAAIAAGEDEKTIEDGRMFNEMTRGREEAVAAIRVELKKEIERLLEYVKKAENVPVFDVDAAISAGEDEKIVIIGHKLNEFSRAMNEPTRGIAFWGNWCGPGVSGPEDPIDALDNICMIHDKCYENMGYFACSCDNDLRNRINYGYPFMDPNQKIAATAILTYFSVAPCIPWP